MLRIQYLLLASLLIAGCKPAAAPSDTPKTPAPASPAPSGQVEPEESAAMNSTPVEGIDVQILDWEQTQALVKKHQGKVVVMDLWATYCPPCIKEFPNLVKLHREHGDKVACISVSTDYDGIEDQPPESYREKVMKFLTKQEATFDNVLLSISAETLFSEKVQQQSIPIVFVYDQKGELRGQFPDPNNPQEFTYQEHVLPLVQKLLAGE